MIFSKIAFAYRYIFYKLYGWTGKVNFRHEPDEIQAVIIISVTSFMYLLGIIISLLIINIDVVGVFNFDQLPKIVVILFIVVFFLMNLYILKYQIGFKKIIQEFSLENEQQVRRGNILVTCYVLGSFVLFFVASFGVYLHR